MNGILSKYLWIFVLVYIDDIIVYSKTFEDHVNHIDWVLKAIEDSGITLSPSKSFLGYQSLLLLDAIVALKPPRNVSELQTFLALKERRKMGMGRRTPRGVRSG